MSILKGAKSLPLWDRLPDVMSAAARMAEFALELAITKTSLLATVPDSVSVAVPLAPAEKVTPVPVQTVLEGETENKEIAGALFTVRVAGLEVAEPQAPVTMQRKRVPSAAAAEVVMVSVVVFDPDAGAQEPPALVLCSHW